MRENTVFWPTFFLFLWATPIILKAQKTAYPLVHEERHHRPIGENEFFRMLHVTAKEGDTTEFHRHCRPILYLTLNGAEISLKEPQKDWVEVDLADGWIGHDLYSPDSCFVHRFAVRGKQSLEILAFEALKSRPIKNSNYPNSYSEDGFTFLEVNSEILQDSLVGFSLIAVEKRGRNPGARFVSIDEVGKDEGLRYYGIAYSR